MYLAQVTLYDIFYIVIQLARAMSKRANGHMGAATHILRFLAGTINFDITYERGVYTLTSFSDGNWGNTAVNSKSIHVGGTSRSSTNDGRAHLLY